MASTLIKDTEHDATVAISNDDLYATGVNHDQSAQVMALESKLAQAECDYNDLTQSFSLKDSDCLLYTSPSPRDQRGSRMPSSA